MLDFNTCTKDELEILSFISLHHNIDGVIILGGDRYDKIVKYFYSFRIKKYTMLCQFINNQPIMFRRNFIAMLDNPKSVHAITTEKNYVIGKNDVDMFLPQFLAEAYTLNPKVNEEWLFNNVNN